MPFKETQPAQGRPQALPIGLVLDDADWVTLIQNCDDRVRESRSQSNDWNLKQDRNKVMYYAGEDPVPSKDKIVFNRIRTEIKTSVNSITRQPATIKLKPIETNDAGEFYSYDPSMPDPIDPAMAQQMMQPKPTGAVDAMGQPQMAPGAQLFKMDDQSEADFWQRQFDVYFKRGKMWPRFRQAAFKAAIGGYCFPLFEWNREKKRPKLWTSISVWDTHTDSIGVDDFDECQHFGVDWLLEAGQAKQMFPEYAQFIDDWARAGNLSKGGQVVLGGGKDHMYERNMIVLRHMWLQNQPILLTSGEAINSGSLPTQEVPIGQPSFDEMGNSIPAPTQTQLAPDPATGMPPQPIIDDGQDGMINPAWPTRLTTRHVVYLPDIKKGIVDEECQYSSIPAGWIPGDPIPDQLFGTGYPESFNSPQMAENRIINASVEYVESFPNPGAVVTEATAAAITKGLKGHMLSPTDMLVVPNNIAEAAGGPDKLISWNVPPALPPAVPQVLQIIHNKIEENPANSQVSRGNLPGAGGSQAASGYALNLLMQQSQNQFDFPAQWFNEFIERISKLMLDAMAKWLTVQDLMNVCSEYPAHIVAAFQRRYLGSQWDVDVTLSNTIGLNKAKQRTDAEEAFKVVDPTTGRPMLSPQTMAERFEESYQEEQRRWDEAAQQPAAVALQQQQQAQQQEQLAAKSPNGHAGGNGNGFGGRMNGA